MYQTKHRSHHRAPDQVYMGISLMGAATGQVIALMPSGSGHIIKAVSLLPPLEGILRADVLNYRANSPLKWQIMEDASCKVRFARHSADDRKEETTTVFWPVTPEAVSVLSRATIKQICQHAPA